MEEDPRGSLDRRVVRVVSAVVPEVVVDDDVDVSVAAVDAAPAVDLLKVLERLRDVVVRVDRGARADDAMRALRVALSQSRPSYSGEFYEFDDFLIEPHAVQPHVPTWVGGRTARSLRRAVELGDGWAPFGLRTAELDELLTRARDTDAWAERDTPIDVILQNDHPWDPIGEPARVADQLGRMQAIGATGLAVRLVHHSVDHYCDQLAALTTLRAA